MKLLRIAIALFASIALVLPLAGSASAARTERDISERIVSRAKISFIVVVKNYPNGRTVLQKAACKTCKFRDYQKKRANLKGRVVYTLPAPRTGKWYWRVYTPATPNYKLTISRVAYTYTI